MYVFKYKYDESFDDWMRIEWMSFWNTCIIGRFCLLFIDIPGFRVLYRGFAWLLILVEQQRKKWSLHKNILQYIKKTTFWSHTEKFISDSPPRKKTKKNKVSLAHQLLLTYLYVKSHIRQSKYYFSFKRCYCHICTLYIVECSTFDTRSLNINISYEMCESEVRNRKASESCLSHVYIQYQVQAANPPETVLYSLSHKVLICSHCLDNNFRRISWFEKYPLKQFTWDQNMHQEKKNWLW